ncbi:hypothetical protein Z043_121535 [Scleropages formosus]|uniref:DUF4524 domain-containing protein n=1 Tax=Scleropages formosus TaxID=113540 RepID=A0A0N8JWB4_SCLFO|nr:hypothetical protein Z043_121535 [Scleropages formosus]
MASVSHMVLFEDQSVEVSFADGAFLQLSPCGCEFVLERRAPPSAHPLEPGPRVRQRSRFATSAHRVSPQQLSNNQKELIPVDCRKYSFIDISEVEWPLLSASGSYCTDFDSNGELSICSLDGNARLLLSSSGDEFSVEFLCRASQNVPDVMECTLAAQGVSRKVKERTELPKLQTATAALASITNTSASMNRGTSASVQSPVTLLREGPVYTWVVQSHSSFSPPPLWCYPLSLAMSRKRSMQGEFLEEAQNQEALPWAETTSQAQRCHLPRALQLRCSSPHLHRWRFRDSTHQEELEYGWHSKLPRVVWSQGVLYRVSSSLVTTIEVFPGDGSVIRCSSTVPDYFTHHITGPDGQESVNEESFVLIKETQIPDVGHLKAYYNGNVTLSFLDRVTLQMKWNFYTSTGTQGTDRTVRDPQKMHSPHGWCWITGSEGRRQLFHLRAAGPYQRHVQAAQLWCRWMEQTMQNDVSQSTSPEQSWSVDEELEKIRRFNCGGLVIMSYPSGGTDSALIVSSIKDKKANLESCLEGGFQNTQEKTKPVSKTKSLEPRAGPMLPKLLLQKPSLNAIVLPKSPLAASKPLLFAGKSKSERDAADNHPSTLKLTPGSKMKTLAAVTKAQMQEAGAQNTFKLDRKDTDSESSRNSKQTTAVPLVSGLPNPPFTKKPSLIAQMTSLSEKALEPDVQGPVDDPSPPPKKLLPAIYALGKPPPKPNRPPRVQLEKFTKVKGSESDDPQLKWTGRAPPNLPSSLPKMPPLPSLTPGFPSQAPAMRSNPEEECSYDDVGVVELPPYPPSAGCPRTEHEFEGMIQVLYQVSVIPVLTCKKWGNKDLPLQPGETIDVIVKPVDDKLIGRNQEGKCCIYDND